MKNYDEIVEALAKSKSTEVIDNSSTEHAATLIKYMFSTAEHCIDLFTGCLSKAVYEREEIKEAACSFMSKGGKLRIIFQEVVDADIGKNHAFLKSIKNACNENLADRLIIRAIKPDLGEQIKSHFLVMDNRAYRYEADNAKHEAVACFNNTDISKGLSALFEGLIKNSTDLKLV